MTEISSTPTDPQATALHSSGRQRLPLQRWQMPHAQPQRAQRLGQIVDLSPLLAQVLLNRGMVSDEQAIEFLNPEIQRLPSPMDEFPDLQQSLALLVEAIDSQQKIAICGDYDADGMTSTALLIRALRFLGAQVNYTIPSRMSEGYGINQRIVEDCYADGVTLILTVDNGIAAVQPIARAQELGLAVIVTDHHDIPPELPPANAILNPKLLPETSPYRGIAGVGVAYVLAVCLAQVLNKTQDLTTPLLELFTLGTIADLAPLTGVNRRWVKRGLGLLPRSRILGVQALIQVAGLGDQDQTLKPEDIGFRLGPRINAVGRISDPQIVIDMLTTEDVGVAIERAMQCEQINKTRQDLCQQIEQDAIAWCEQAQRSGGLDLQQERVLVVVQPDWHHGVIGIVASRLVERYGVPVFIGTFEDEAHQEIRGSARGIPEFDVFEALQSCDDLLHKYGGHRAAGGFTFAAKHLRQVKSRLANYARGCLRPEDLKPLVRVDVEASLSDICQNLYDQIDALHPCGIENPDPVFWTPNLQILEQRTVGRNQDHLKLVVTDGQTEVKGIAWRWGEYYPLPARLDLAYKLKLNEWQGSCNVELELVGVRLPGESASADSVSGAAADAIAPPRTVPAPLYPAPASDAAPLVTDPGNRPNRPQTTRPPSPSSPPPAASPIASPVASPPATPAAGFPAPAVAKPLAPPPAPAAAPDVSPGLASGLSPDTSLHGLPPGPAEALPSGPESEAQVEFFYSKRRYWASISTADERQLTISNPEGHRLVVQMATRQGHLWLPEVGAKPVDISEAFYFNLVRTGLNALEIQQKTLLLLEKDEQLAAKDDQIAALRRQVAQLEQRLRQVDLGSPSPSPSRQNHSNQPDAALPPQAAQVERPQADLAANDASDQEALEEALAIPSDPKALRQELRQQIGDQAWFCLSEPTQTDLYQALQQRLRLQAHAVAAVNPAADYSALALGLGSAVDRDIVQPFLTDFLASESMGKLAGLAALGTHPSALSQQSLVPVLLSKTWKDLKPEILTLGAAPAGPLYRTVRAATRAKALGLKLDAASQQIISQFLADWDHPIAPWFGQQGKQAATILDQCHQLLAVATNPDQALAEWQYELLHTLVLGDGNQPGLFTQAFGG